jgi:hypothetical protein
MEVEKYERKTQTKQTDRKKETGSNSDKSDVFLSKFLHSKPGN